MSMELIKKYEEGAPMTPDEKELLTAALYFAWRQTQRQILNLPKIDAALARLKSGKGNRQEILDSSKDLASKERT